MRVLAALLLLVAPACGPKPQPSWVEHDSPLGESHAAGKATRAPMGIAELATLDAATIETLDEATVLTLLERLGEAAPAARLALRGARLAAHEGDDAAARALLVRAATADDAASVQPELAALAKMVAASVVDPSLVAVLLPLSGRYASIGRELRAAIELAPAKGTTWLFVDTKGDATMATAAVEHAFAKGAVGILGPVGQLESIAAARAAAGRRIPIALLSPADGADPRAGVFRVVDSPADEGRAIARLAQTENFPTVGVFAPRDDVGAEAAEAFVAEAQRLGLAVTANGTFDPTNGDLEGDVKRFLGLVPATNPRFAAHLARYGKKGWTTFTPDVTYTLLYIPDRYDRGAIVAAFLPYYNVELRTSEAPDAQQLMRKHHGTMPQVVQLVGGSGWNDASLPIRGGRPMQGALVVDAFARDLGGETGAQFTQDFTRRTNRVPSTVAAEAYDAAMLVATARAAVATAADPRMALREQIARSKLDDGACGPAAMAADGELRREPTILEVAGDQLIVAP